MKASLDSGYIIINTNKSNVEICKHIKKVIDKIKTYISFIFLYKDTHIFLISIHILKN